MTTDQPPRSTWVQVVLVRWRAHPDHAGWLSLVGGLLLISPAFVGATPEPMPEPTIVRLSIWGPPESRDSIATVFEQTLKPILIEHGFIPSNEASRPTIDSVYARLLEIPPLADLDPLLDTLKENLSWRTALHLDADTTDTTVAQSTRWSLNVYRAPAGPGHTTQAHPGERRGDWEIFDAASGLPLPIAQSVAFGDDGIAWIGTAGGLVRYDGLTMTTYDRELGHGIDRVCMSPSGDLWMANWRGLKRFDGHMFEAFDAADGIPARINALLCATDGSLWAGTRQGNVLHVGPKDRLEQVDRLVGPDGEGTSEIATLAEDRDGKIWVQAGGGLFVLDESGSTPFDSDGVIENQRVMALATAPHGVVWLATPAGVFRFDGGQLSLVFAIEGDTRAMTEDDAHTVRQLFVDSDQALWTVTNGGIQRRQGATIDEYPVTVVRGPQEFVESPDGTIWVGTFGSGLARNSTRAIRSWASPHDEIYTLLERASGDIWLGTPGGTFRFEEGRFWEAFEGSGDRDRWAWHMAEDRNGRVWGAQWWGDRVWHTQGDSAIQVTGLSGGFHILPLDDGNLWWLGEEQILRWAASGIDAYSEADGFFSATVWDGCRSASGDLWFAHGGGVSRLAAGTRPRPETVTTYEGPGPTGWAGRIHCGALGEIWVVGATGLSRFDPSGQAWRHFTEHPAWAMDLNGIWDLDADRRGNLLISGGNHGFIRYDGKVFQTLDRRDGLAVGNVFGAHQDRQGAIWLNTSTGVSRYRPSPGKPILELKGVVADRSYEPGEEIAFPSTQHLVEISYQGRDLKTRPGGMVYRYRLVGHDTSWAQTNETSLVYEDLPAGDYFFEVEAVDRDLGYSDLASLAFRVHPPYTLIGLLAGLVVALGLVGWQTARVVRRDRRLQRTNQAMSDANNELFQLNLSLQREQVLERLRGQAQGMQTSGDLEPVVEAIFQELSGLGMPLLSAGINVGGSGWRALEDGSVIRFDTPPMPVDARNARERGEPFLHRHLEGEAAHTYIENRPELKQLPEAERPQILESYSVFLPDPVWGAVRIHTRNEVSEENLVMVQRFSEVFAFAYQRWQDLQVKETQNQRLAIDAAVNRLRAEVQTMDETADFERILSLLTESLDAVGIQFDGCEIDVLDVPVEAPTMAQFEVDGFRYTTFTMNPGGDVSQQGFVVPAPFPGVIRQTIERFIAGQPWQAVIEDQTSVLEVPAGGYGRLRLSANHRQRFADEHVATLREFADAVALGYARYLDIKAIQEGTERKSAFLAAMSHELRTPMNAIKGFTKLVIRRCAELIPDQQLENLHKVDRASNHLLAQIDDLLDLSKIEAGRMDVNLTTFDLQELVESCVSTVSPLVKTGVLLESECHGLGKAHSDEDRLRQMLINLLSNAIKFTDRGQVRLVARREGDELILSVSDTGKGIPAAEIPILFDEYRQVKGQSESDVQKGTGLGLSITKKFAELLGGRIEVRSEVGAGSTFTLRIPAASDA